MSSPSYTKEGLPLDFATCGAPISTSDAAEVGGPSRRVASCHASLAPPSLAFSAPLLRPFKAAPTSSSSAAFPSLQTGALTAGLNESSLIDDDDEIMDYFGGAVAAMPMTCAPAPTSSYRWTVRDADVPALPAFYPLEKSAVFVPRASAPIVASRIAAVLETRSIAAAYDSANAKVDCLTKGDVEFRVRLYRGRGECTHGVIVEVQRRAGFDLSYSRDVYAVLDAAEGKTSYDLVEDIAPQCYQESGGDSSSEEEDMDDLENRGGRTSLRLISDILCPGGEATVEGRVFALSSLASLTSVECMGQAAVHISNELLTSEEYVDLRRAVFLQVGPSTPSQERSMIQSLRILANIASLNPASSSIVRLLTQNNEEVLLKLVENMKNAPLNPCVGELSCIILNMAGIAN